MTSFAEAMNIYREQLAKGAIQIAYKGLMDYFLELRTCLKNKYPNYFVSGSLYFGYMDMTYFSFTPKSLQDRSLKIAIVFLHEASRFEVWLGGYNKQVQGKYWKLIKSNGWDRYSLVPSVQGEDAIIQHILVEHPDFGDLTALSAQIEGETMKFISDVETFLAGREA